MAVLATTELEAVNIMLAAIGEAPVATLEEDTIEDAQIALATLRDVSKEVQNEGWHFNTDYDYPFTADAVTGKITYPTTAAHVDAMDTEGKDIVKRGGYMYDRENRTDVFELGSTIKCKVVWFLDFTDLPESCRKYIIMLATRRFAKNHMGDEATVQFSEFEVAMARAIFKGDEMRRADLNMLQNSNSVNRAVRRRSPWPV